MEQHPIPQQISSYEFKLVGEMTLKQFLKAAAGIVLAILINTTKLVVIIKWPLMLLVGGGGLLLAFVPFEDRPLETWIMAFIKSIYAPTIYTYKKKSVSNWLDIDLSKQYDKSDEAERPISNDNVFVSLKKANVGGITTAKVKDKFRLGDLVQSIRALGENGIKAKVKNKEKIEVEMKDVGIKSGGNEKTEEVVARPQLTKQGADWRDEKTDLNLKTEKLGATGKAIFGSIPMPDRPEIANVIVGMATDIEGKIVDGVIIEIQDEHGSPLRVIKTNSLGQFKISTPLANGRYLIIAEKEGYVFDRVNVDLGGKIIEPIRIIAHN